MKYSIRTAMFATTGASLLFAALFFPNEATACTIVCAFIMAIAIAWLFVIERWPEPNSWCLGFAISGVCLSLSGFRLPFPWTNQLAGWLHGLDNAPWSGVRPQNDDFHVICNYVCGVLLAVIIASVLSVVRPKRLMPLVAVSISLLTVFATWVLSNVMLCCIVVASVFLLSWAWFVVLQKPIQSNRWLLAFVITTTAAVFCLQMHIVPGDWVDWLYGLQHTPPDEAAAMRNEMRLYPEMLRVPMTLLLGAFSATLLQGIIRQSPK